MHVFSSSAGDRANTQHQQPVCHLRFRTHASTMNACVTPRSTTKKRAAVAPGAPSKVPIPDPAIAPSAKRSKASKCLFQDEFADAAYLPYWQLEIEGENEFNSPSRGAAAAARVAKYKAAKEAPRRQREYFLRLAAHRVARKAARMATAAARAAT
jgi:hypothetical protein